MTQGRVQQTKKVQKVNQRFPLRGCHSSQGSLAPIAIPSWISWQDLGDNPDPGEDLGDPPESLERSTPRPRLSPDGTAAYSPTGNQSNHLGIHKQTNACWSIPRSQTVFYYFKICRKWELWCLCYGPPLPFYKWSNVLVGGETKLNLENWGAGGIV